MTLFLNTHIAASMRYHSLTLCAFVAFFLCALTDVAHAQRVDQLSNLTGLTDDRIAAVVNENIITTQDINSRIKLAMISSGLPETDEVRHKLMPQILRGLIDEQLQVQEAKRLDVTITDDEINQTLARIAHDNNIPVDMKIYIAQRGGSVTTLQDQIRAGLAWSRVVQRELRPRVEIGDDEIESIIQRMRENIGKEEYLVSEIFLAVDSPKDEEQVKQFSENLAEQLKAGANFAAIARQFSQGTGAASGGDIGWIQESQLSPELNRALPQIEPGQVSTPIRSTIGYHILGVREKRTVSMGSSKTVILKLQQAFHAYGPSSLKADVMQEAELLRAAVHNCKDLHSTIDQKFTSWHLQDYGDINLDKTPSWLADKVRGLSTGSSTIPMATDKGAIVFFVCDRHGEGDLVDREAITSTIGTEKLELQARRLLRDLRRDAYLDIRIDHS